MGFKVIDGVLKEVDENDNLVGVQSTKEAKSSVQDEEVKVLLSEEVKEEKPKYIQRYINGSQFMVTDEQNQKYESLLHELSKLQEDTGIADIPLSHPYYKKKEELDLFVSGLKR